MHILILDDMINQLEAQNVFTHEEGATYWTGELAPQLMGKQQQRQRTKHPARGYLVHSPSLQ
jgi:putative copper export protein